MSGTRYTRRGFMRTAGGAAATVAMAQWAPSMARAAAPTLRRPDSLPDPTRPAGTPTAGLPFDHIVIVMQENHSFDNYFGMLPRRGQPAADGFTFDRHGTPVNSNPLDGGIVRVAHAPTLCQPVDITQAWNGTHEEIDHGAMDGFARVDQGQMLYYDESDIPFYYSFASAFCLANRWFSSAPCQTYPNRRFLLCGTAFGLISTDTSKINQVPPNGTIVDRLNRYGISWKDYFVDVPATGVIMEIPQNNPQNMAPIADFFTDCRLGTLPSVSFVDSEIGALNVAGSALAGQIPIGNGVSNYVAAQDQDEENPADIQLGESFVQSVVEAVIASPAWPRTLLIWTYDEHGGFYDHVPPPAAIAPDSIPPDLGPHDYPGGYDMYGPRVPAVVASPYSKPHSVSDTVCDHTSVLATVEAKWNLPACTYRDANANTVASFLDGAPALLEPPMLADSGSLTRGEENCDTADPHLQVLPAAGGKKRRPVSAHPPELIVRFLGRSATEPGERKQEAREASGVTAELRTRKGTQANLEVEFLRRGHVLARAPVKQVGTRFHRVDLDARHALGAGRYTLVVKRGSRTLLRRSVELPRR